MLSIARHKTPTAPIFLLKHRSLACYATHLLLRFAVNRWNRVRALLRCRLVLAKQNFGDEARLEFTF
jgi:hypothetical protein